TSSSPTTTSSSLVTISSHINHQHHRDCSRQPHPPPLPTPLATTSTAIPSQPPLTPATTAGATATAVAFSAAAAAVAGYGWQNSHHRRGVDFVMIWRRIGAVRRQTTIVAAVGRRHSHYSRTLWCRACGVQIILTGIDNDIYSIVDACPNACEMWKAIEGLKQGESINVQDLETNLYWEFGKFTSQDGE
nr:hypothetical protein [Tanacetum cinerariifolium]